MNGKVLYIKSNDIVEKVCTWTSDTFINECGRQAEFVVGQKHWLAFVCGEHALQSAREV